MSDRELGQFLNWFIKRYGIGYENSLVFYTNAEGNEVSIAEILEHYNKEK